MQKILILLFASLSMLIPNVYAGTFSEQMSLEDLPKGAQLLIKNNFNTHDIISISEKDSKRIKNEYQVKFKHGKKAIFNSIGDWVLLDFNSEIIPYLLVPSKIRNTIAERFGPHIQPVAIRKYKKKIWVRLDNSMEMIVKY